MILPSSDDRHQGLPGGDFASARGAARGRTGPPEDPTPSRASRHSASRPEVRAFTPRIAREGRHSAGGARRVARKSRRLSPSCRTGSAGCSVPPAPRARRRPATRAARSAARSGASRAPGLSVHQWDCIHEANHLCDVVTVRCRGRGGQWNPVAVRDQVVARPRSTLGRPVESPPQRHDVSVSGQRARPFARRRVHGARWVFYAVRSCAKASPTASPGRARSRSRNS